MATGRTSQKTRFVPGLLIGLLASLFIAALFAVVKVLPSYSDDVEARLVSSIDSQSEPQPTPVAPVPQPEVTATVTVGEELDTAAAEPARAQELALAEESASVRLPAEWSVEYKPGDLISLTGDAQQGDSIEVQILTQAVGERSCEVIVAERAQADNAKPYISQETNTHGCRAQGLAGARLTVVGFQHGDQIVLFAIERPTVEKLKQFEALVASFSWRSGS